MTPKPLMGLYCVCDPAGNLVHTTVFTTQKESIEEWMKIESNMNDLANMCRTVRHEPILCFQSWEQFEAEGYTVVPVVLLPSYLDMAKDRVSK